MLRQSAERDRAEHERRRLEQERVSEAAAVAAARAAALEAAHRDLERAIGDARDARRKRSGVAAADEAWRRAKARVIELETGSPPEWGPDVPHGVDE